MNKGGNRAVGAVRFVALVFAAGPIAAAADAALINVGQIDLDRYMAMGNGVEITAHFTLNAAFNDQDCCRAEDLRWIQRVSTTRRTGFSPPPEDQVPPRPFIDPRNGQNIGGGTMGDNLPFYDVTFAMDPVTNPTTPLVQNGSGRFIYDKPALNAATSRPNTFCAETLLVCIKPGTMMMAILGGFSWGFDINADGSMVMPKATMALSDTAQLRMDFNTALGLDFPGWSIISGAEAWPDMMPIGVTFVPAPGAALALALAVPMVSRRRRAASSPIHPGETGDRSVRRPEPSWKSSEEKHMNHSTSFSACICAVLAVGSIAVPAGAQIPWHLEVNLPGLHQQASGFGILVGQIELGTARREHVSLDGATPGSKIPFFRSTGGANQNDNHATAVASLIAGRTGSDGGAFDSGAPNAKLAISNWVDAGGASGWEDNWLGAMTDFFRVAPTTPVLSTSAGWSHGVGMVNQRVRLQQVADWMGDTGYLFCVLAGNSGMAGASTLWSPSGGYNVLTVGATGRRRDEQNYHRIADFSSRGPALDGGGSRMKPDLVAPGTLIYSAVGSPAGDGSFNRFDTAYPPGPPPETMISGTSFATPIVAGISACLHEWGAAHGLNRDPRVMRAVLMNSTSKAVEDDVGVRWDRIPGLGQGANSISNVLGTGQVDGFQAWQQYRAGQTHVAPVMAGFVPELGFDLSTTSDVGVGPSYLTNKEVRRGSYMTSTLCWNRPVNSGYNAGDGTNNWANWSYGDLQNLDIKVARPGGAPILSTSNATDGTSEHNVFKAPDRNHFVWRIDTAGIPTAAPTFGFAWEWTAAPTYTKEYNGNFRGNSHGNYLDDGWYRVGLENPPPPTISRPAWLPAVDPINAPNNDEWALQISSNVEAAQELVNPLDIFTISFKYGFDAMNGTLFYAMLGNLNLFELAGIAGGAITPDATNTGMYKMFNLTIGRNVLQEIMGDYTELKFGAIGGPDTVWIDDVVYVPPPGAMVVMAGLALFQRRRRGA